MVVLNGVLCVVPGRLFAAFYQTGGSSSTGRGVRLRAGSGERPGERRGLVVSHEGGFSPLTNSVSARSFRSTYGDRIPGQVLADRVASAVHTYTLYWSVRCASETHSSPTEARHVFMCATPSARRKEDARKRSVEQRSSGLGFLKRPCQQREATRSICAPCSALRAERPAAKNRELRSRGGLDKAVPSPRRRRAPLSCSGRSGRPFSSPSLTRTRVPRSYTASSRLGNSTCAWDSALVFVLRLLFQRRRVLLSPAVQNHRGSSFHLRA